MKLKKFLIFFSSMLLTMLLIFVISTHAKNKEYKCLAELYPDKAAEQGLLELGGTVVEGDGHQYRVMAESKHLVYDVWLQFIDTTNPLHGSGELDNICDLVIKFQLIKGNFYRIATWRFVDIAPELDKYCNREGILIKDWIHFAKPVKIVPKINS